MNNHRSERTTVVPLKAAIVITGLEVGGAETFLAELLAHKPAEIEMRVFQLIDGGPIAERIRAMGIPVTGLHMRAGNPSLRGLRLLAAELRAYRPDIVHTWMYHADLLGGVAAKFAGVSHVAWHLHNSDLSPQRVRLMTRLVVRACAILSYWIPQVVFSCSEAAVATHAAKGYDRKKFKVVPNGVDTERFHPSAESKRSVCAEFGLSAEEPLVGLVARVDPQKNHEGFFRAVRAFFEAGGTANFLLAGRDVTDEHWQLPGWRELTGHPERIVLVGARTDVPRLMAAFDVGTSSSLGEAFPMVLIEAMSCATPCAATDVGDSALIVADTGVIVAPDDAEALAGAWRTLIDMPQAQRAELGERARARVLDNYAIGTVADEIWGTYRRMLGHPESESPK